MIANGAEPKDIKRVSKLDKIEFDAIANFS
jgi:hypothetical protein